MFYYKFNLKLPNFTWTGTKACKKIFEKPQWLRNIKDKKYPFYRIDTFFKHKIYKYKIYRQMEVGIFQILKLQLKLKTN